ncbi:MAG: hypothetical protein LBC70_06570 [Chitinispirillales bacterium]|nr:hypothetical protein [Chitinispirillales bacterium]
MNNGAEGEIYLSQINSAGIRTPNVAIPFNARHYAVGDLSFTVSRISSEFNAYVLHPITVTANLSQADLAHIDSVVLLLPSSAVLPRINLLPSNNFTGNISFTDTGSYLCEARIFGMMDGTAYRDTSFVVRVGVIGDVPLTVTPVNNRFDGYALAPISIVASPRQADRDYIDSIVIFLPNGAISQSQRISLLPSNNFTGSVTFADTGNYISEARIYGATGNAFRETSLNIRAGVDFGIAGDLKFEVEDTGDDILLRAVGYKADGVYWEWGLSRIRAGLGNRRTMADTVIVNFAGRAATDTLFLSQVKLDTVAGIPQEYRIQRAFIYTASIKMYSVNIEVVGDAKVVFNPGTSFSVTSGATSRISYIFALGTTRSFLTRVDSVTVNGERLALDIRNMGGTSSIGDYTAGLFDVNHIRSNLDIKFYAQIALRLRLRWPTRTLNWSYDTRNESGAPGWGFSNAFAGEIWGGEAVFNQYLAGWSLGSTIPDTELFDCAISRRMVFTTNKKLDRNAVWEFVYNDGNNERVLERPMGEGGLVAVAAAPISGDYYDNFLGKLVDDDLSWTGTNNVEAYIIQLEPDNASLKAVRARFVDAATGQQIIVTFNTIWGPVPWGPSGGCSATESSGFNYITGQSVGFNGPLYPNGPNVYNFVEIR